MSEPTPHDKLDRLIAEFLEREQAGQPTDREAWFAQHPDVADSLRNFFAEHDRLENMVGPLRERHASSADSAETVGPGEQVEGLETVPYFGDYELLEEIARGGMGVVYRARQVSLQRIVAVKMILAGQFASDDDVARFHAEAEAAANLDHPHILPIYEVGEHQGQHYFSMKYVEGGSLDGKLDTFVGEPREVAKLMVTVAHAVHYAHQRSILHRDLKPSNILLDEQRQPYVTDFGLAKQLTDSDAQHITLSGAVVGTPSYMAPEQARAEKTLSTAIDVHALGAILYELLTGRPPFRGENVLETLHQVVESEPASLRSLNGKVDRDLETICLKCLNKDPVRRYASAEALAEDLERWLVGEPIRARATGTLERALKWMRRRPAIAGMLALIVALLIAGVAGVLWQYQQAVVERKVAVDERTKAEEAEKHANERATAESLARAEANRLQGIAEERLQHVRRSLAGSQLWRVASVMHQSPTEGLAFLHEYNNSPIDLRGFVWNLYHRVCKRDFHTQQGHLSEVRWLRLTLDGTTLLSLDAEHRLHLWDVKERRIRATFENIVAPVVLSENGKTFAWGRVVWDDSDPQKPKRTAVVRLVDVASGKEIRALRWSSAKVAALAFDPTGETLAVSTAPWDPDNKRDGSSEIRLWSVEGKELGTLKGHTTPVHQLAFSPDGRFLGSASGTKLRGWSEWDGLAYPERGAEKTEVKVWDRQTNMEVHALDVQDDVFALVFQPNANRLAVGTQHWDQTRIEYTSAKVTEWDVSTGKKQVTFEVGPSGQKPFFQLQYSPNGKRMLLATAKDVRLWEAGNTKAVRLELGAHETISWVDWTHDGKSVLTDGGGLTLWDTQSGQLRTRLGHRKGVDGAVALSPFGDVLIAAGHDGLLRSWNLTTGLEPSVFYSTFSEVNQMTFNADGNTLALVLTAKNKEKKLGRVELLDVDTGKVCSTIETGSKGGYSAKLNRQGTRLADFVRDGICIWDVRERKTLSNLEQRKPGPTSFHWLSDGTTLVTFRRPDRSFYASDPFPQLSDERALCEMCLWNTTTGQRRRRIVLDEIPENCTFAVTETDDLLLAFETSSGVEVRAVLTNEVYAKVQGYLGSARQLTLSPNGKALAAAVNLRLGKGEPNAGDGEGEVWLWQLPTARKLASYQLRYHYHIQHLTFGPDSATLLWAEQSQPISPALLHLWDVASGQEQLTLETPFAKRIALRPGKQLLLVADSTGILHAWHGLAQPLVAEYGHQGVVNAITFDASGKSVISGSDANEVQIRETATGQERTLLADFAGPVKAVATSPDGKTLATGSQAQFTLGETVLVRDLRTGTVRRFSSARRKVDTWVLDRKGTILAFPARTKHFKLGIFLGDPTTGEQLGFCTVDEHVEGFPTHLHLTSDGSMLVTSSGLHGLVSVWEIATQQRRWKLESDDEEHVTWFEISPDDKLVAVAYANEVVRLWDLTTGKLVKTLKPMGDDGFRGYWAPFLTFSPDGRYLTLARYGEEFANEIPTPITLWNLKEGDKKLLNGHRTGLTQLIFSPDGKSLVSGDLSDNVIFWDLAKKSQRAQYTNEELVGLTAGVNELAWSWDSKTVAIAFKYWSRILLIDTTTGKQKQMLKGHWHDITSLCFTPDNKQLLSGSRDGTIRRWDLATGKEVSSERGAGIVWTVWAEGNIELSIEARPIRQGDGRTLKLWDMESHQEIAFHDDPYIFDDVWKLAYSPDGKYLAIATRTNQGKPEQPLPNSSLPHRSRVVLWNTKTHKVYASLGEASSDVLDLAFSPDGKSLAVARHQPTITLWDVATGTVTTTLRAKDEDQWMAVAFAPDGKTIAAANITGEIALWNSEGKQLHRWSAHQGRVLALVFSPDGKHLASGGEDKTVRRWNATTGESETTYFGHSREVRSVAFSPDGHLLVSGSAGSATPARARAGEVKWWRVRE